MLRAVAAQVPIGAHVDASGVLEAAAELGADCMQIFLSDPGSWRKPPPHPEAGRDPRERDRRLRPRAVPDQRLLAEAERPLRLAQDPPADLRRGRRGRRRGGDRPRRPRRGRHRRGPGRWLRSLEMLETDAPVLLENTAGGDNAVARRFDALARLWEAIGDADPGSTSASASTPATPTPPARSSPTRSSGCSRSPAGSTSCTPTTRATRPAPAPTATSASARARSTPTRCGR